MPFETPHPGHTGSPRARAGFRLAVQLSLAFVALLWAIQLANAGLDLDVMPFGVRPRTLAGLAGILFAPLVHAGFDHLIANTLSLAVAAIAMLHLYPRSSRVVLPAIWLGPGIAVWLFARGGNHVGASGLVYGLAAYVFAAGLIRRDRRAIAASLLVAFMYGASVWGVLPIRPGHSWETHLAAALIGLALAALLRDRDTVPRVRYEWESEGVVDLDHEEGERQPAGSTAPDVAHGEPGAPDVAPDVRDGRRVHVIAASGSREPPEDRTLH
ncbi:MAG: rhomboid family intramembrane serine protease [Betaproteobacteria bacterium]|nr:rhomboid family intramembrane serine protease [Betaproteobacteria bacterium]